MATVTVVSLDGSGDWIEEVRYGQLENSDGGYVSFYGDFEAVTELHTFFVSRNQATKYMVTKLGRDIDSWSKIATDHMVGPWSEIHECLWSETPIFTHVFPDKTTATYGMTMTPDPKNEGQYLWYVILESEPDVVFLVGGERVKKDQMDRLGQHRQSWNNACVVKHLHGGRDPRTIRFNLSR